jgi:hypothetical protein
MGALTEIEIWDCLKENLAGAADDCEIIARQPSSGPEFVRMRQRLKLCEGACRQLSVWRQDTRWLPLGLKMEQAHQKAREWLHRPSVKSKKLFALLASALRKLARDTEILHKKATGRVGMILPKVQREIRTAGRPMQVPANFQTTTGGILLPK